MKKPWERRATPCAHETSCGYFLDENVEDEAATAAGEGGRGRERGRRRRKKRRGRARNRVEGRNAGQYQQRNEGGKNGP